MTNPLPNATMSMSNFATPAMGNLSPLAPTGGFSNEGGTGNRGSTTAGVSIDHFNPLMLQCDSLKADRRELKASREDTTLKINGKSFSLMREFVTFFDKDVRRLNSPGAADEAAQLQVCFLDGCGLLALAYNDKDDSTTKDIARLMNSARKAEYKGVNSLVIANTFASVEFLLD